MSPFRDHDDPRADTPEDLARALDHLPPARPRPEFAAELERRFLAEATVDAPPSPGAAPRAFAPAARVRPRGRRWVHVVAIAAAAAIALAVWRWPYPSQWQVIEENRFDAVSVDGRVFGFDQRTELAEALVNGSVIETREDGLDLRLGERLAVALGADTALQLVHVPEPAVGAQIRLETLRGHVSFATGPEFPGNELVVRTRDVQVAVTGTEFAIDVDGAGTCVCCADGEVRAVMPTAPTARDEEPRRTNDAGESEALAIESGKNAFFAREAGTAVEGTAVEEHLLPIARIRAAWDR
jgi:ferric-dicitrate binding protein FerR (iron transport regulator)